MHGNSAPASWRTFSAFDGVELWRWPVLMRSGSGRLTHLKGMKRRWLSYRLVELALAFFLLTSPLAKSWTLWPGVTAYGWFFYGVNMNLQCMLLAFDGWRDFGMQPVYQQSGDPEGQGYPPSLWSSFDHDFKTTECDLLAHLRCGGFRGVRVGEAQRPGPARGRRRALTRTRALRLWSSNCRSLPANFDQVRHFDADVLALQESRTDVKDQERYGLALKQPCACCGAAGSCCPSWSAAWGAPMGYTTSEAGKPVKGHGGTAVLAREPGRVQRVEPMLDVDHHLLDSGRSVLARVPYGNGRQSLYVSSFYGISNHYKERELRDRNETLLSLTFQQAESLGEVPVVICADLNCDPSESATAAAALASGRWVDVGRSWHEARGDIPPATHSKSKRFAEADTRIDVIFANREAWVAIRGYRERYDVAEGVWDHAPLEVEFDFERLEVEGDVVLTEPALDLTAVAVPKDDDEEGQARLRAHVETALRPHQDTFEEAIARRDVQSAWRAACMTWVDFLLLRGARLRDDGTNLEPEFFVKVVRGELPSRQALRLREPDDGWGRGTRRTRDLVKVEGALHALCSHIGRAVANGQDETVARRTSQAIATWLTVKRRGDEWMGTDLVDKEDVPNLGALRWLERRAADRRL